MNLTEILNQAYTGNQLLCCGGASGHMQHIFEDPDLTFKELKDIFTKLFTGKIGIEEKCLSPDSKILTEHNGEKTIAEIVDNKLSDRVLSYNDDTKQIEYADIVAWIKNDIDCNWLKINLEDGSFLICTPNHRVFLVDENTDVKAEQLKIGDKLLTI